MRAAARAGRVRPPAQAGRFYPAEPERLRREVLAFLTAAPAAEEAAPKAVIAPHAGYRYSGPIAASAYAAFRSDAPAIRRVVLLGPSHWADFEGVAAPTVEAFATPLGEVAVDRPLLDRLVQDRRVTRLDSAHEPEHSLEVHLPWLQVLLPEFTVAPLLVGRVSAGAVADLLDAVWNGTGTRIVISSDLSHYLDYATARAHDAETAERIRRLAGDALTGNDACGYRAVRGLLAVARRRGLRCRVLDLRNSGDTAGGHGRVVGYGAFAFDEPAR